MKRIFIVKPPASNRWTSKKHMVKHGSRSLHPNKGRFVLVHIHGWFAHGTLDRF